LGINNGNGEEKIMKEKWKELLHIDWKNIIPFIISATFMVTILLTIIIIIGVNSK